MIPKLFQHQRVALRKMRGKLEFALFLEQGLGKTRIILEEFDNLYTNREIDALIVVAPNGVHFNWTRVEIPKYYENGGMIVLEWSQKYRTQRWKRAFEEAVDVHNKNAPIIFVVNIEALSVNGSAAADYMTRLMGVMNTMFVVDESSRIKTPGSKRTKRVIQLGKHAVMRRILTGTPVTQSPFDLYSQFRFLNPDIIGFNSFYAFKNRYGIFVKRVARIGGGSNLWTFDELVEYQRIDELTDKIKGISFRRTRAECLDLPPKMYQTIPVELSKQQQQMYRILDKEGILEFEDFNVLAPLQITRLLKCQEIIGGFVNGVPIDGGNPRLAALIDAISDDKDRANIVIWARFRNEIEAISMSLRDVYGDTTVVEFHGGVSGRNRANAVKEFQDPDSPVRFMIGQQQAGIGVTLTAAERVYYYSNTFSYEQRYQTEDRCHRIGTTKSVLYIDLIAADTVDEKIIRALKKYRAVADKITGDSLRQKKGKTYD